MLHLQYFHNIFRTNHKWKVVIGSNLNSKLKLLFYPSVTTNNNLTFRICYENVVNITFPSINRLEKKKENFILIGNKSRTNLKAPTTQ